MKLTPTIASQQLENVQGGGTQTSDNPYNPGPYYDVSLESPDAQFQVLTDIIEANDAQNPSPDTGTPPWGETTPYDEYIPESVQSENYLVAADLEPQAENDLTDLFYDAYGPMSGNTVEVWDNDPQYYGLGVPPGVPNWGQPIESGHTQIVVPNPSAELGWDSWSGRPILARVARHENAFSGYSAGVSRGHMLNIAELQGGRGAPSYTSQRYWMTRNLMLSELNRRGIHNVVVDDVPAQTYNEQVQTINPVMLMPEAAIGPEGVLP